MSTKHLLESLNQWAKQEVDDKFVSDAYVKLGNDFRGATRAFTQSGVDISDIGDVPQELRIILESALSEPASQSNLDRFLPQIRNIIVVLLQNLKAKQNKLRSVDGTSISPMPVPQRQQQQQQQQPQLQEQMKSHVSSPEIVSRNRRSRLDPVELPKQRKSVPQFNPPIDPGISYHSGDDNVNATHTKLPESSSNPKKDGALLQLQNENVLQRRASKRFSAYQYAKLTNITPSTSLPNVDRIPSIRDTVRNSSINYTPVDAQDSETYIFLKIDKQTKKVMVKLPITFASLRLLFVEKFAYSPGSSDFPIIYVEDPKTSVSYELEDQYLKDIQPGTLLCLNINPETVETVSNAQNLQNVTDQLQQKFDAFTIEVTKSVKEVLKEVQSSVQITKVDESDKTKSVEVKVPAHVLQHVSSLENDLRVLRQVQTSNKKSVQLFVDELKSKVKQIQDSCVDSHKSSNRVYMEKCNNKLSEESDSLLTKVDDLQDLMEGLRKDVAQRGVRISGQQLNVTLKEINEAYDALNTMTKYINSEKPIWKKIWESELDRVCEEQQFFNLQDDLTRDLQVDLSKIKETFDLIEQCSVEQGKLGGSRRNKVVANLHIPEPGENLHDIKDAVLNEVASLKPDHESRVEAINRAERLREKERKMMKLDEFQEELGSFVDESKLKKSGGIDEIERQRQLKDAENLRNLA